MMQCHGRLLVLFFRLQWSLCVVKHVSIATLGGKKNYISTVTVLRVIGPYLDFSHQHFTTKGFLVFYLGTAVSFPLTNFSFNGYI